MQDMASGVAEISDLHLSPFDYRHQAQAVVEAMEIQSALEDVRKSRTGAKSAHGASETAFRTTGSLCDNLLPLAPNQDLLHTAST